jgi:hypothetical protein
MGAVVCDYLGIVLLASPKPSIGRPGRAPVLRCDGVVTARGNPRRHCDGPERSPRWLGRLKQNCAFTNGLADQCLHLAEAAVRPPRRKSGFGPVPDLVVANGPVSLCPVGSSRL